MHILYNVALSNNLSGTRPFFKLKILRETTNKRTVIFHIFLIFQAEWWDSFSEADSCDSSYSVGVKGCTQGQRSRQRGRCAANWPGATHLQPGSELLQWASHKGADIRTHSGAVVELETGLFEGFLTLFLVPHQDNAIYNLLPDIISRLSDPERGMSSEDFNTIMKWDTQQFDSGYINTQQWRFGIDVISGLLWFRSCLCFQTTVLLHH